MKTSNCCKNHVKLKNSNQPKSIFIDGDWDDCESWYECNECNKPCGLNLENIKIDTNMINPNKNILEAFRGGFWLTR